MPHLLGYARVSTTDQTPDLQLDALKAVNCYRVFVDTASGALDDRPQLARVLDQLRPGDTLVVWKLDRLGPRISPCDTRPPCQVLDAPTTEFAQLVQRSTPGNAAGA
jgi:DNA invertase Pin-like site-specific DNA recombinase